MIERGDIVTLLYTCEDGKKDNIEILYVPCGCGDNWQVRDLDTGDVTVINTYHSAFLGMVLDTKKKDRTDLDGLPF